MVQSSWYLIFFHAFDLQNTAKEELVSETNKLIACVPA